MLHLVSSSSSSTFTTKFSSMLVLIVALAFPSTSQGFQSVTINSRSSGVVPTQRNKRCQSSLWYSTTVESDDAAAIATTAEGLMEARLRKLGLDPTRVNLPTTTQNTIDIPKLTDSAMEARLRELGLDPTRIQLAKKTTTAAATTTTPNVGKPSKETIGMPATVPNSKHSSTHLANVQEALSAEEFQQLVVNESKERLTIVRFYAPWCQSCRRTQPFFERFATANKQTNVNFVTVPQGEGTKFLIKQLGVQSVPFAFIYHPNNTKGRLVEELSMNKNLYKHFQQIAESYINQQCDLPQEVDAYTGTFKAPYERRRS